MFTAHPSGSRARSAGVGYPYFKGAGVKHDMVSGLGFLGFFLLSFTVLGQSGAQNWFSTYYRTVYQDNNRNSMWIPVANTGTMVHGKPTVINRYIWRGNRIDDWMFDGAILYNYDQMQRPTLISEVNRMGDTLRKTQYAYDLVSQRLSYELVSIKKAGVWADSVEHVYAYQYNPVSLKSYSFTQWFISAGLQARRTDVTYNDEGKPLDVIHSRSSAGRAWKRIASERYRYDAHGLERSRLFFEYTDNDSSITSGIETVPEVIPVGVGDTVYRSIQQWQITDRGLYKVREDVFTFANGFHRPPTAFNTHAYNLSGQLISQRRFYDLGYTRFFPRNPYNSIIERQTEQVWNGNAFVDNSRVSRLNPGAFSTIITERAGLGGSFVPSERISNPVDSFNNPVGQVFEVYDNGAWAYDPSRRSTIIQHTYSPNLMLTESRISYTDTGGFVVPTVMLEYLNFLVHVPQASPAGSFTLYPNPVQDVLSVKLPEGTVGAYKIWSATGIELETGELMGAEKQINTAHLAPGVYTIRLKSQTSVSQQKFVKQ